MGCNITWVRADPLLNNQLRRQADIKPGTHKRKQLSKKSCKAVSSAVFSHVCINFGDAKIIKHD